MQVIKVYDKNSDLRCYGKNIFKTMNEFMNRFPFEYRKLYDKNLESLQFMKCDRLDSDAYNGTYDTRRNVVFFTKSNALAHEMFHVASYDAGRDVSGFECDVSLDQGLLEGMTEYFRMKAFNLSNPEDYNFEVFSVMMLENINDIFKHYFIPNHSEFIKLFPNKKDIYNLLFSLDEYNAGYLDYLEKLASDEDAVVDIHNIKMAIKNTINNLITIELSMVKDKHELLQYRDKFMDLIGDDDVREVLSIFYPRYYGYADMQTKKRILER